MPTQRGELARGLVLCGRRVERRGIGGGWAIDQHGWLLAMCFWPSGQLEQCRCRDHRGRLVRGRDPPKRVPASVGGTDRVATAEPSTYTFQASVPSPLIHPGRIDSWCGPRTGCGTAAPTAVLPDGSGGHTCGPGRPGERGPGRGDRQSPRWLAYHTMSEKTSSRVTLKRVDRR